MSRHRCCHGEKGKPCTCEMGNLYRFVEPIVLLTLMRLGSAHGYQIAQEAECLAVTHAGMDVAAVYRALRRLEVAGHVDSVWDTEGPGPARRQYTVTNSGKDHLRQWTMVLEDFMASLAEVVERCKEVTRDLGD